MKPRPNIHRRDSRSTNKETNPLILDIDSIPEADHPRPRRFTRGWLLLGLAFVLFLIYHNGMPLYTDWLWFQEVGYTTVFSTTVVAKTLLFVLAGGLCFAVLYGNAAYARRIAPDYADRFLMERLGPEWGPTVQRYIGRALLIVSAFVSLWAGRLAAENWGAWLEFTHGVAFHITDPVFKQDIGFYMFRLPFLEAVHGFFLSTLLLTLVVVVVIHFADQAIESFAGLPDIRGGLRAQLLLLVGSIAIVEAFGTRLRAFDLLRSDNGIYTGAGYVDIHWRLLANSVAVCALIFVALACLVSIRLHSFRWPLIGAGVWLFALFVLGGVWPGILQKTSVDPNQFSLEKEYIARNIDYTRQGFGLTNVWRVDNFAANNSLTATQIQNSQDTMENVRLWDYPYLGKVYGQLQTIKPYYKFESISIGGQRTPNIDVDRYTINGRVRQVMLAGRELDSSALPEAAQTWQNQKLAYTHGYGLVMSPVNKTIEGNPDYFLEGFPPQPSAEASDLHVTQPEIYYGLLAHEHVYVNTQQPEFDYPSTEGIDVKPSTDGKEAKFQDHYTNYHGKGGIVIGNSYWRKLAFASRLGDWNLLLANNLTNQTRILYRRDIRDRLQTVAPFVQQDADPYLVLNPDNGKLLWIIDCYTMSDRYPYSTSQQMMVSSGTYIAPNYIRNSIKATVDAYDGTINLYVSDPKDPIARTYDAIYPGLLKPLTAMPAGLQAHLRYPEDLFRLQRSVYAIYHVDDPRVFYLKEDVWAVPTEPNGDPAASASSNSGGSGNAGSLGSAGLGTAATPAPIAQMEPYYVIMHLPALGSASAAATSARGESSSSAGGMTSPAQTNPPIKKKPDISASNAEFVLMSPLAPIKKEDQNILGWMCARCDGMNYGQLVLYRFPQQVSVEGPSQIVQLINSDKVISPQLSLLRQGGSTASLGNMLVIPIEQSLLYIAPLYVESTSSANKLPKLQKVIVAYGTNVTMADTLEKALAALFVGAGDADTNTATGTAAATGSATQQGGQTANQTEAVPPRVRSLIEKASGQYDTARQKLKQEDLGGYAEQMKGLQQTLNELRKAAGK